MIIDRLDKIKLLKANGPYFCLLENQSDSVGPLCLLLRHLQMPRLPSSVFIIVISNSPGKSYFKIVIDTFYYYS